MVLKAQGNQGVCVAIDNQYMVNLVNGLLKLPLVFPKAQSIHSTTILRLPSPVDRVGKAGRQSCRQWE